MACRICNQLIDNLNGATDDLAQMAPGTEEEHLMRFWVTEMHKLIDHHLRVCRECRRYNGA